MREWITTIIHGVAIVPPEWEGKEVVITLVEKTRTPRQNDALHLWFCMIATALNDAGYDIKKTLQHITLPWTPHYVKDFLWRPFQVHLLEKKSTTLLTTTEIDKVYAEVDKRVGQLTGVRVDFPSEESMRINSLR